MGAHEDLFFLLFGIIHLPSYNIVYFYSGVIKQKLVNLMNLIYGLNCIFVIFTVHPSVPGLQSQSQGPYRTNGSQRHGSSPTPGLSKWFGSDVLEQPLPSMPAKVISVDELEFRP